MKLHDLKSLRASKVLELKALIQKDEDSADGMDDAEATRFDALKSEIDNLDTRVARIESAMSVDADTASDDDSSDEKRFKPVAKTYARVQHVPHVRAETKPGFKMARYAIGMYHAQKSGMEYAANFIEDRFGDTEVAKALNATLTATQGPETIPQAFSTEFIELLRPWVAVRALDPVIMDLTYGNLRVPRQTAASTANYIGELQPIPTSQPAFDDLYLSAKKLAAFVPVSNDLMRRSPLNIEEIVRDDMVQQVARKEDAVFIRSLGGSALTPTGLLGYANNTFVTPASINTASPSGKLDSAWGLIQAMVVQLENNLSRMIKPGWIMNPNTRYYLAGLRDGVGGFPLKAELDAGTLMGFPYKISQQIPGNLTAGSGGTATTHGSEIYLADFADVIIGQCMNVQLDMSNTASYVDNASNQINSFQNDTTVFRVITEHDFNMRHLASLAVGVVDSWYPSAP